MQCLISVGRTWISNRSRDAGDEAFATAVPRTIPAHPNRSESRCRREVGITCVCLEWSHREEPLVTKPSAGIAWRVFSRVMAWLVGSMPFGHGAGRPRVCHWNAGQPHACVADPQPLTKAGGKQIGNAPLVYRLMALPWGVRINFSGSFLSWRTGRNEGFVAISHACLVEQIACLTGQ